MGCFFSKEEQNEEEIIINHKPRFCGKCCSESHSYELKNEVEDNNSLYKENGNNKDTDEKQNKYKKYKNNEKMNIN